MTSNSQAARRSVRTPLRQRSRKRWAIAGGVAAAWMVLYIFTGSVLAALVILLVMTILGITCWYGLRALGVTRDHPWLVRMASRPWRDGQDVLKVAMRHMPDVFVVTPSGSLLAPNVVELQLNADDLDALCDRMELGVICSSLSEVYEEQVAEYEARYARPGRPEVYVIAGPVPPGRYRLRQGEAEADRRPKFERADVRYPDAGYPDVDYAQADYSQAGYSQVDYAHEAPELAYARPQQDLAGMNTRAWYDDSEPDPDLTIGTTGGMVTVMERETPAIPLLRLVTGDSVAETRMSGARAGRGFVELVLPEVPTVSREHATFTFVDGQWWIANQGRNGLTLNGSPVTGGQPLTDGDTIRWGARSDALMSRVEIS